MTHPAANAGWMSVGIDHDTAAFAVATIRHWWEQTGRGRYPQAHRLLITADGGGSNGSRTRLWKREVQQLADHTGLAITVCHYPPGTSKWNKIEHRLFAFLTQNWRGHPLVSYAGILSLIAATTTATGLPAALLAHFRQAIETLNSQLAEHFLIEHNRAKSVPGLCCRIMAKLTAHTIGLLLNCLLGRPLRSLKALALI